MQSTTSRLEVRDYFRIIQKRKWFIILVSLAAMLIGGLYAVSYPKSYRATSLILVKQRPRGLVWLAPQGAEGRGNPGASDEEISLDTQANLILGSDLSDRVCKALRERRTGDRIVADATEIQKSLKTLTVPPDRIRVDAESPIERNAISFANEAADQFLEVINDIKRQSDHQAREYLEQQLKRTDDELTKAEEDIAKFEGKAGMIGEELGAAQMATSLASYRAARDAAASEVEASRAQMQAIDGMLAEALGGGGQRLPAPNPAASALTAELTGAQVALGELRSRYQDGHPAVRDMEDRVKALQEQLTQTPATLQTPVALTTGGVLTVERQRQRLLQVQAEARQRSLDGAIKRLQDEGSQLPAKIATMQRLRQHSLLLSASRERLMMELENRRLQEEVKGGSARVLDKARSATPTSPSVSRGLLFSGVLGVVAGVALALLLEALDDTIHTPEQLQRETDIPFLGMVPLLEEGVEDLITVSAPKSPPAETYRTLRSNVNFALVEEPARRFLITSAGAGEGKSITAANLAVVFAQAGQSVILCDTDLRRPSLHRTFHGESTRGLTNVLVGEATLDEVLQDTHVEGLRLLATGPLPPNPAEMLDSAAMRRLIDELLNYADIIFFDSPPTIVLTDASILASKVERVILVCEAGQVTRDAFEEAVRLLQNARGRILGIVLNKLRLTAGDYYYYYYYYDYSREASRPAPPPPPPEEE